MLQFWQVYAGVGLARIFELEDKVKRLIFLMSLFYLIQVYGGNPGLFEVPLQLYLKETLGFSAEALAWFGLILSIPWTIKPLWGIISDSFPLCGYQMRSYFFICYLLAFALFIWLGFWDSYTWLVLAVAMGLVSAFIAFSDVLTDKLMVVEGKPRGKTGVLQAAQWSALGFGGFFTMYLGGWIAENADLALAFLLTAAAPLVGLLAAIFLVKEKRIAENSVSFKNSWLALLGAFRSRQFLMVALFIAALRLHIYPPVLFYQRNVLAFSKQFVGTLNGIEFLATGIGAIVFGFLIGNISRKLLLNMAVGLNVLSTLGLIFMHDETSAVLVYAFVGFTSIMASLGVLELAARSCPAGAEGTSYALLVSVYNLCTRPGFIIGSILWDRGWSFAVLVLMGTALTAVCWILIPLLKLEQAKE